MSKLIPFIVTVATIIQNSSLPAVFNYGCGILVGYVISLFIYKND